MEIMINFHYCGDIKVLQRLGFWFYLTNLQILPIID